MNGPLEEVDATYVDKWVTERIRQLKMAGRFFQKRNLSDVYELCQKTRAEIEDFMPKVPLLVALRRPGITDRHWKQISDKLSTEIIPNEDFTFHDALKKGLLNEMDFCVKVGERASKEYGIRRMLDEMKNQWKGIKFDLKDYPDPPNNISYVVRTYDEINAILDEHIQNT